MTVVGWFCIGIAGRPWCNGWAWLPSRRCRHSGARPSARSGCRRMICSGCRAAGVTRPGRRAASGASRHDQKGNRQERVSDCDHRIRRAPSYNRGAGMGLDGAASAAAAEDGQSRGPHDRGARRRLCRRQDLARRRAGGANLAARAGRVRSTHAFADIRFHRRTLRHAYGRRAHTPLHVAWVPRAPELRSPRAGAARVHGHRARALGRASPAGAPDLRARLAGAGSARRARAGLPLADQVRERCTTATPW